jgi:hypothetical protein
VLFNFYYIVAFTATGQFDGDASKNQVIKTVIPQKIGGVAVEYAPAQLNKVKIDDLKVIYHSNTLFSLN